MGKGEATAPNGAVTAYSYDSNDNPTAQFAPQDTPTGPARETTYSYDLVGNLASVTEPDGNQPSPPSSYTTTLGYDAVNELTSKTDAASNVTKYGYNDVGDRTSVTDPLNHTTGDTYNQNHWLTATTDPAGYVFRTGYDLDGLVSSTKDQNGNQIFYTRDPRGDVIQQKVPHDTSGGTTTYNTTQYTYDQAGNKIRVVTPRGVAAGVSRWCSQNCAFTQVTQYDADNRVSAQLSAYDPADPVYNTPAETDYSYDPAGRLSQTSVPPSGGQTVRNLTTYSYWDNGWTRKSTDPWGIVTSYDYNPLGQQASRTIAAAGEPDCQTTTADCRTQTWGYYPDGKLQARADNGVPTGLYAELADNSDFNNTSSTGAWATATSGTGYQGYNYQTHAAGSGSDAFTWNLNIPQTGNYSVYVKYPPSPARPPAPRSRSATAAGRPPWRSTRRPARGTGSASANTPSPKTAPGRRSPSPKTAAAPWWPTRSRWSATPPGSPIPLTMISATATTPMAT